MSWADGVLEVRKKDGTVVTIPEESLVAARVVPAAPPRPGRMQQ
ncbi:hypothetical protein ACFQ0B_19640 [Nonomuraea thailandensis]